jgi:hypothetical protein
VAFMAKIYRWALRVVIWLGPESRDRYRESKVAIDCMEVIKKHTNVFTPSTNDSNQSRWHRISFLEREAQKHRYALAAFFDRPWFKRLWVWQEVHLSNDRAIVVCGADTVGWSTVLSAIKFLASNGELQPLTAAIGPISSIISMSGKSLDPCAAWISLRNFDCTDARDRIYAASGLSIRKSLQMGIVPDYTSSVRNTYTDAAAKHIRQFKSLHILNYVGNPNMLEGLPSWVPDWNVKLNTKAFGMASAGTGVPDVVSSILRRSSRRRFLLNDTLSVRGKIVARINNTEPCPDSATKAGINDYEKSAPFRAFMSRLANKGMIHTREGHLEKYSRVFWANDFTAHGLASRQRAEAYMRQLLGLQSGIELPSSQVGYVGVRALEICQNRCFFTTREGGCGLAPKCSQQGDIVAVIPGIESAMTLRSLGGSQYSLIGPTWIDGYMQGEAVRGPLPSGYELIQLRDLKGVRYDNYIRWPTYKILTEDPRLGELPPGWRRVEEGLDYTLFQHCETGQRMHSDKSDPRLSLSLLEAAGHKFETFNIV